MSYRHNFQVFPNMRVNSLFSAHITGLCIFCNFDCFYNKSICLMLSYLEEIKNE